MKAPKRPTYTKGAKPYAAPHSTRSQGQTRRQKNAHNTSIIDNSEWNRIQARYKQQQQEVDDAISSTPLSSITFNTATFSEATLATPDQQDARATNLTDYPSSSDGFLPPKAI